VDTRIASGQYSSQRVVSSEWVAHGDSAR
jgi:hypothetical protein